MISLILGQTDESADESTGNLDTAELTTLDGEGTRIHGSRTVNHDENSGVQPLGSSRNGLIDLHGWSNPGERERNQSRLDGGLGSLIDVPIGGPDRHLRILLSLGCWNVGRSDLRDEVIERRDEIMIFILKLEIGTF